jgi:integrase
MPGRPRLGIGGWGKITTTKTKNGDYRAITRFKGIDGVIRRISARGSSITAAERELKERLIKEQENTSVVGEINRKTTVKVLTEAWLHDLSYRSIRYSTKRNYKHAVKYYILPEAGHLKLEEMSVAQCNRILQKLQSSSRNKASLTRNVLGQILKMGVEHGALTLNPMTHAAKITKPSAKVARALTPEQVQLVREAIIESTYKKRSGPPADDRLLAAFELMIATGARIGEVLALRRCDVDLKSSPPRIDINGTITYGPDEKMIRGNETKTRHSRRVIAIGGRALKAIEHRIKVTADRDETELIFASDSGTIWYHAIFQGRLNASMKNAGLQDLQVHAHLFRSTVATHVAKQHGIQAAASLLGHGSIAITEQFYLAKSSTIEANISLAMTDFGTGESSIEKRRKELDAHSELNLQKSKKKKKGKKKSKKANLNQEPLLRLVETDDEEVA